MKHGKFGRRLIFISVSVIMVFVLGVTSTFARYYKTDSALATLNVLDYNTSVVSLNSAGSETSFQISSINFYPGLVYQKIQFRVKSSSEVPVGYNVKVTTTGNQPLTIKFLYHVNNSSADSNRRLDGYCGYDLNAANSSATVTKSLSKDYSLSAGTNYQDFDLSISWYNSSPETGQTNSQAWRKDAKFVNEIDYITVSINSWQA